MTVYAVGDIHGQLDALKRSYARISEDRIANKAPASPIVLIGDYVDRGPDARGVLDWLVRTSKDDPTLICLKGNHDRMMCKYLRPQNYVGSFDENFDWLSENIGGMSTLESYGVKSRGVRRAQNLLRDAQAAVPAAHLDFLESLPLTYRTPALFFAHAGIRPGVALDQQIEQDLIWIRGEFLNDPSDHGALIVHGHTPVREITHSGNHLNIDTGAAYGRALSIVVIEGRDVFELSEDGRRPVPDPRRR